MEKSDAKQSLIKVNLSSLSEYKKEIPSNLDKIVTFRTDEDKSEK